MYINEVINANSKIGNTNLFATMNINKVINTHIKISKNDFFATNFIDNSEC